MRKGTQAKVGPLSGTRLQIGAIWGQTPLLARRAVSITAQPRRAECSARWCEGVWTTRSHRRRLQ